MDGDRLGMSVESADGRVIRWAGDEPDAEMIPGDLEFSTALPGGYKDLSCSLLRRLGGDERLFDNVRVYGPGNRTAWDGRLVQFPREDLQVNPGAVGWSSHLRDDPSFKELYIDQDMGRWTGPSLTRRIAAATAGLKMVDGTTAVDSTNGLPAIILTNEFPAPSQQISEMIYDAGAGLKIAKIRYAFNALTGTDFTNANWTWGLSVYDDDTLSGSSSTSGDLSTAASGSGFFTPATARRVGYMYFQFAVSAAGSGQRDDLSWQAIVVYGNHGLTLQGTSGNAPGGYYGHDLIRDIVSRGAPLLSTAGIETNTSFVVPQAAFLEPTTPEQAVMLINGYFLNEWGVYDNREFFWRAPDPERLVWRAREDMGAHVSLEGQTAEAEYNGVLVNYTDPMGVRRIAGPPATYWQGGVARCDVTNSVLVDTTSTNSVNRAGIPRKWGVLDIGPVTTDAGAVQLGYVWLAERSLPQRRGTITVSGAVEHPTEGLVPPWRIKAGDSIQVIDRSGDEPKRIIETRYSRGSDTLAASVGNTDFKLDAILERIGVQLVGVI